MNARIGFHLLYSIALALLWTVPARAADDKGLYQTLNFISCQQYMDDRKLPMDTGRNAADEIYVSGWLSAYNYLTPNTYDIVPNHDVKSVMAWLDKYCDKAPAKNVEAGLLQFTGDAYPGRTQSYVSPKGK